jgi:drug/metabolite transporter (DMT)-like permease
MTEPGRKSAGAGVVLAVLGAVFLWASAFPVMKALLARMDPWAMIWARMAVATLLLAPLMWRAWPRARRRPGDLKWLLLLVLLEPCLYFILEITALRHTSAAQAGMVVALFPLMAALGGALFFKERLTRAMLAGLLLSVAGVIGLTLAGAPDLHAPRPWLGNFLEFLAMICGVGYMLIIKRLAPRYDIWLLTGLQMSAGFLFFLPGARPLLMEGGLWRLDGLSLLLLIYLGAGVTVLAYGLYNIGISRLPAASAAVLVNLLPVITLGLSWGFLGERLNALQLAFAVLTLAGVFLAQKQGRSPPAS